MKNIKTTIGALITAATLLLASVGPGWAMDRVTVQLHANHQAEFAGFYAAIDAGIYRDHGLEVTINPGSAAIHSLTKVERGEADFATAWLAKGVYNRAHLIPIVNLAQINQRTSVLLVAFKSSGIKTAADLAGKKVGLPRNYSGLGVRTLFRREGITVREIEQSTSLQPLLHGAVTAMQLLRFDGLHGLFQRGVAMDDLVIFDLGRLGINFPEDGLYCLQSTWIHRPDLCRRFVKATMDGWRWAFDHENEALDSIMKRVRKSRLAGNRSHQRWMLREMKGLITYEVEDRNLGRLSLKDLTKVRDAMLEQGLIPDYTIDGEFAVPAWK